MPTSNGEELRLFLKCTVIGHGVFGRCACCACGKGRSKSVPSVNCRNNSNTNPHLPVEGRYCSRTEFRDLEWNRVSRTTDQ